MVSEVGFDLSIKEPLSTGIAFAAYDRLADACFDLVHDQGRRKAIEQSGFELFRSFSQVEFLHSALEQSAQQM